jgi:hypothetical protein
MSKILADSWRTLTRLVGLNFAFDVLSIPIWIGLTFAPTSPTGSTLTVNTSIAIIDAAAAAILFAAALLGILKKQKWGTYLAVAGTVAQRIAGVFIFALNLGMAIEVVWSILIIFFAYKALQLQKRLDQSATSTP